MQSSLAVAAVSAVALAVTSGAPASRAPEYRATVAPLPTWVKAKMTSWQPGCPVAKADLRYVTLLHWNFGAGVSNGRMVVHRNYAAAVVRIFRELYDARFPIRRMRLVEAYGADDDRSMAADNTSAFNCRRTPGSGGWSEHAHGRAIDVNPLENPEIRHGVVSPPAGARFVDRTQRKRGMIHENDRVVRAFARIGWGWGGHWKSLKDYQHFSATGR